MTPFSALFVNLTHFFQQHGEEDGGETEEGASQAVEGRAAQEVCGLHS